ASADPFDIDHRHYAADRRRELDQACLVEFLAGQWFIRGAEVHRAGLDLGDATARADRLVIDHVAGGGVVVRRPLGNQREDEGRAGAGDLRADLVVGGGVAGGVLVATRAGGQAEREGQGKNGDADRRLVHRGAPERKRGGRGRSRP